MRNVELEYYKPSGKYYSGGSYESSVLPYHDWEIYAEVREMKKEKKLPGLVEGCDEFHILITGSNVVPHLILLDEKEKVEVDLDSLAKQLVQHLVKKLEEK